MLNNVQTAEDQQEVYWLRRFDAAAVVAVASAVGYLVAYLDRLGEALYYGIPIDYVSVSVADVLLRASVVVVALGLLLALALVEKSLGKRLPYWCREPLNTASTWLLFALLALVLAWNPRLAVVVAGLGAFYTVAHLAIRYPRRRRLAPPPPPSAPGPRILSMKPGRRVLPPALVVVLLVSALVFAFLGGNSRAASRQRYLVSTGDPQTVLLVVYSDNRAVLATLDGESSTLTDTRSLAALGGDSREFVWRETGRISWPRGWRMIP